MFRACCAILLSIFVHAAVAESSDHWSANIYIENDLFGGTDQNYTNGLRLSLISPNLRSYRDDPAVPDMVNRINTGFDKLFGFSEGLSRNMVTSFGHLIYTPKDEAAVDLVEHDRPYAGYLYVGFGYHARTAARLDSVEINMGVVGPSAQGEWAQNTVHDLRGFAPFEGWANQLQDELTLQAAYERKYKLLPASAIWGALQHDFISHAGVALGSLAVHANVGGEYRMGWHLPKDFGTSAVRPGGDNSAPGEGDTRFSNSPSSLKGLHGFIAFDARAIARDIFLDGNNFKTSHSVAKAPFVAEFSIGLSVLLAGWKLSYAQVFRTKEFKLQQGHHEYGSLSVSYSF